MFEAFYNSTYQQPLLLWVAIFFGTLLLIYWRARGRLAPKWLVRYCAIFTLSAALDAWLTANTIIGLGGLAGPGSLGTLKAPLATIVPIFFIILGDYRYFLLIALVREQESTSSWPWSLIRGLLRALPWAFVVPLITAFMRPTNPRVLYLAYEMLFLALVILRHRFDSMSSPSRDRATFYFFALYACWALADIMILSDFATSAAWLLRTFANLLYYAGWAPYAYWHHSESRPYDRRR